MHLLVSSQPGNIMENAVVNGNSLCPFVAEKARE